jgi:hypothetical protein
MGLSSGVLAANSSMAWTFGVAYGTPTPAGTATFTPTPTASPTPLPVSTPFVDHFNYLAGAVPTQWTAVDNTSFYSVVSGSAKAWLLSGHLPGNYGTINSDTYTINVTTNNMLRLVVNQIDSGVGVTIRLVNGGVPTVVASSVGRGITEVNIQSVTGWTGPQTFYIQILLESGSANLGVSFDEMLIYPSGSVGYASDFNLAGALAPTWHIEYNAAISSNSTTAYVTEGTGDLWGSVTSDTMTLNIDNYYILSVVVNQVIASGNRVFVHESGQSDIQISGGVGQGVTNIDLRAAPLSWSGTKTFYLRLVVEPGSPNVGTQFDGITIGSFNQ